MRLTSILATLFSADHRQNSSTSAMLRTMILLAWCRNGLINGARINRIAIIPYDLAPRARNNTVFPSRYSPQTMVTQARPWVDGAGRAQQLWLQPTRHPKTWSEAWSTIWATPSSLSLVGYVEGFSNNLGAAPMSFVGHIRTTFTIGLAKLIQNVVSSNTAHR